MPMKFPTVHRTFPIMHKMFPIMHRTFPISETYLTQSARGGHVVNLCLGLQKLKCGKPLVRELLGVTLGLTDGTGRTASSVGSTISHETAQSLAWEAAHQLTLAHALAALQGGFRVCSPVTRGALAPVLHLGVTLDNLGWRERETQSLQEPALEDPGTSGLQTHITAKEPRACSWTWASASHA